MPYFILYNKNYLMLLDYKGREAGQSFTFTICRLEKNKNKKGGKQMGARKKPKPQKTTHI